MMDMNMHVRVNMHVEAHLLEAEGGEDAVIELLVDEVEILRRHQLLPQAVHLVVLGGLEALRRPEVGQVHVELLGVQRLRQRALAAVLGPLWIEDLAVLARLARAEDVVEGGERAAQRLEVVELLDRYDDRRRRVRGLELQIALQLRIVP